MIPRFVKSGRNLMRKSLAILIALAAFGPTAGTAVASKDVPEIPEIPQNCHEWNQLLGIDNVQSCDGS
jgi:hypothetical protein